MFIPIGRCITYRCNVRLRHVLKYSTGVTEESAIKIIIVEVCSKEFPGFGEFYPTSLNLKLGIPGTSSLKDYREKLKPLLNKTEIKLMIDQQARNMADITEIVSSKCADVINFYANWHSGFSGALERATVVKTGGMENFVGSSIYTGIADAANIMLSSVFPDLVACEQVNGRDFYLGCDSVVEQLYPLSDEYYHIPERPGLGIEINREKLERMIEGKVIIK